MAPDWQVSEVADTCRFGMGSWRSVHIERISAWIAHLLFRAFLNAPTPPPPPHLLVRENIMNRCYLRQDPPPLDLSFWSFLTFLHHGIEEVERHLLWKLYKKIRRKSWSNVPPKLLACLGFLYKVVHKIGRLRKFNRSREIEFNFLTAWTISMKFGTLVQHTPGYKTFASDFSIFP